MARPTEYGTEERIAEIYAGVWGALPDKEGLDFWVNQVENTEWEFKDVAQSFFDQDRIQAKYSENGTLLEGDDLLAALYENIFRVEEPDAEGFAFWQAQVEADPTLLTTNIGTLIMQMIDGMWANEDAADVQELFKNFVTATELFIEAQEGGTPFSELSAAEQDAFIAAAAAIAADVTADSTPAELFALIEGAEWPGKPLPPGPVEGETFWLTQNADFGMQPGQDFYGTSGDDLYYAPITTVNFINGNTLNSGDRLDGNGGYNTLEAELINDGFFQSGIGGVRPTTQNIQEVKINAILTTGSADSGDAGNWIQLDAYNMTDIEHIGSYDSNASLVIRDLNTKTSDGGVRDTDSITIRMDHTSNYNTSGRQEAPATLAEWLDWLGRNGEGEIPEKYSKGEKENYLNDGASNLKVYFDENYLLSGERSEFDIQLRIVNTLELATNNEPLEGFKTITFSVGDQAVTVDIEPASTYAQVVTAINDQLAADGITGVTASLAAPRNAVFTDDINGFTQGQIAGQYLPIDIISTTQELSSGPIELLSDVESFDGLNTWVAGSEVTEDLPLATNIEFHKVGRGDEGGYIHVGGKAGGSIDVINVAVLGDALKPSDVHSINTGMNQGGMDIVNIETREDYVDGDSWASLRLRNDFNSATSNQGSNVSLLNANDFLGDLTIGGPVHPMEVPFSGAFEDATGAVDNLNGDPISRFKDIEVFTATGGGDVQYWAQVGEGGTVDGDAAGLPSLGNLDYSATTGDGDDAINVIVRGGAQMNIDSGAGDDFIQVNLSGNTDSGSTQSGASITSMSGNNTINVINGSPQVAEVGGVPAEAPTLVLDLQPLLDQGFDPSQEFSHIGSLTVPALDPANPPVIVVEPGNTFDDIDDFIAQLNALIQSEGGDAVASYNSTDQTIVFTTTATGAAAEIIAESEVTQTIPGGFVTQAQGQGTAGAPDIGFTTGLLAGVEAVDEAPGSELTINPVGFAAETFSLLGDWENNGNDLADTLQDLLNVPAFAGVTWTVTWDGSDLTITPNSGGLIDFEYGVVVTQAVEAQELEDSIGGDAQGRDQQDLLEWTSQYEADITTGNGADVVDGGGVSITASTGGGNDVIYAENTGEKTEAAINAGVFADALGASNLAGSVVNNVELMAGRQVQITVAMPDGTGLGNNNVANAFVNGFELTATVLAADGPLTTEVDVYTAVANAINNHPVVGNLVEASVDSNGVLTVEYLVDGFSAVGDDIISLEVIGPNATTLPAGLLGAVQAEYSNSDITQAQVLGAINNNVIGTTEELSVTVEGTASVALGGENTINAGTGQDVIVLSSDDVTTDTVVFDAGAFGTNTIVHFNDDQGGDVLDFTAWLNNVESATDSVVSQVRIDTAFVVQTAFQANSVVAVDFGAIDGLGAITEWGDLTSNSAVLAALNDGGTFASIVDPNADLVGNTQKSILMIQNDGNLGEYKVFEVTSDAGSAGGDTFNSVSLVGVLDFGEEQNFDVSNFA